MGKWQPIDTAPKDGRRLLVCYGPVVAIAHWAPEGYWYSDAIEWIRIMRESVPTHWMPCPSAPEPDQG